jgi:hypothetical protein
MCHFYGPPVVDVVSMPATIESRGENQMLTSVPMLIIVNAARVLVKLF